MAPELTHWTTSAVEDGRVRVLPGQEFRVRGDQSWYVAVRHQEPCPTGRCPADHIEARKLEPRGKGQRERSSWHTFTLDQVDERSL